MGDIWLDPVSSKKSHHQHTADGHPTWLMDCQGIFSLANIFIFNIENDIWHVLTIFVYLSDDLGDKKEKTIQTEQTVST